MTHAQLVRKLTSLAKTMTQSEAARALGLDRRRVHVLSHEYGIPFKHQRMISRRRRCLTCATRLISKYPNCLKCKWTPARIKELRASYGLSQIRMSLEIIKMNVWAVQRWENSHAAPTARSMMRLERAERALQRRAAA